jgi:hypothetical protein
MGWIEQETNKRQDHVIAHVVGATVLGYFIFDESMFLLLDIGFIWQIYLDGEMGLLPYSVCLQELVAGEDVSQEFRMDSELLLTQGITANGVKRMTPAPVECLVKEVTFFADDDEWRLLLKGEESDLILESSLSNRQIVLDAS